MGKRLQTRIAASIACVAIVLASLMPAMSHAVSRSNQHTFSLITEICSVNGTRLHTIDASSEKASDGHPDGTALEHCPFCLTHAGSVGLPSSESFAFPIPPGVALRPALFFHSPSPLFAWISGQPRAPPFLS